MTAAVSRAPAAAMQSGGAVSSAAPGVSTAGRSADGPRALWMTNFPASWAADEAKVPKKIRDLLGKFGPMHGAPIVSRSPSGALVAVATFEDPEHVRLAISLLNNVDNRTQAEKKKANGSHPKDHERFVVQAIAAPEAGSAPADPVRHIWVTELPLEWPLADVKELVGQYGAVESIKPHGPGRFFVSFLTRGTAESARNGLNGLQVEGQDGRYKKLRCEIVKQSAPAAPARTNAAAPPSVAEVYDPEMVAAPVDASGPPVVFYIDELCVSSGEPDVVDREIYLRDLPLEDYTEPDLREWLDSFGKVESVVFIADPVSRELSGRGYVRFSSHEDAVGLIAAFPVDDADGNVQGCWSLSERALRGASGQLRVDITKALAERLPKIKSLIPGCSGLILAGGGRRLPSQCRRSLHDHGFPDGPLHFAAWPQNALKANEHVLRSKLLELVKEALADPGAFTGQELAPLKDPPDTSAAKGAGAQGSVPDPVDGELSSDDDVDDGPPTSPCIVLRGFPGSWTEQQVKLVFALYGGVATVRFVRTASGRTARVELKAPENMEKAVENLDHTQVGDGDLIEECTITCELAGVAGGGAAKQKSPMLRTVFVDELDMPRRPNVTPSERDREVFLSSLPVQDCSEDEIRGFLEGFGKVEEMYLLRHPTTGDLTGRGYARFAAHQHARACVEAQSANDPDEGDVVASWSESERALQRAASSYGLDVHAAFLSSSGLILSQILLSSRVKDMWMLSEVHQPNIPGAPKLQAKQLHFTAVCEEAQLEELRKVLSSALTKWHDKVNKRMRDPKDGKDKARRRASATAAPAGPEQGNEHRQAGPPPGDWYAAAGGGGKGDAPPGWFAADGYGKGGYPPHSGYPQGAGVGGPPPPAPTSWLPAQGSDSPGAAGQNASGAAQDKGSSNRKRRHGTAAEADEEPVDPELQDSIDKGEKLVVEARAAAARKGGTTKAYDKYCQGLQFWLDVLPKLERVGHPRAASLRLRINHGLEEAETQKKMLLASEGGGDGGGEDAVEGNAASEAPVAGYEPADGQRRRRRRHGEHKEGVQLKPRDAKTSETITKGEELIKEGEKMEEAGHLTMAYENYCKGLQELLSGLGDQAKDDPNTVEARQKVDMYLKRAEQLKQELGMNGSAPGDASSPAENADRSRSRRQRNRKRSSSGGERQRRRGDRDGHGGAPAPIAASQASFRHDRSRSRDARSRSRRRHRDRDRHRERDGPGGGKGNGPSSVPATRMKWWWNSRQAAPPGPPPVSLKARAKSPSEERWAGAASKAAPSRRPQ